MKMLSPIVPYVDLAGQHAPLRAEILEAVAGVIDRGQFILGPEVAQFETAFAQYCRVEHAIGVASGMDALVLSLRALDIGPGDEVITAPNSFIASTSCIALCGATPVLVDVLDDYMIDPVEVERAITARTKAILPVHLTGKPANMTALGEISRRHGVALIEDAAQAVGAEHAGQRVGSSGTLGCFSLHPLKTLNACGDAGVITTNDAALAQRLRELRNLGLRTRDDCVEWAPNSRLDTMQAAILMVKLPYLERWTSKRIANAAQYRRRLENLPDVRLPVEAAAERCVYHTFVIRAQRRDALKAYLEENQIGSSIHYPVPIHLSTAGRTLGYAAGSFPKTELQAREILSLPVHDGLDESQIDRVCDAITEFYAKG